MSEELIVWRLPETHDGAIAYETDTAGMRVVVRRASGVSTWSFYVAEGRAPGDRLVAAARGIAGRRAAQIAAVDAALSFSNSGVAARVMQALAAGIEAGTKRRSTP